jgi:hypothetical protein
MRKLVLIGAAVTGAVVLSATPISVKWSAEKSLTVSQDKAYAVVGRPATPGSVAGFTGGIHGGPCAAARRASPANHTLKRDSGCAKNLRPEMSVGEIGKICPSSTMGETVL